MDGLFKISGSIPMMADEFFDDFMNRSGFRTFFPKTSDCSYPKNVVRVVEDGKTVAYRIEYALAGFKKEEIKVSVSNGILSVTAAKEEQEENSDVVEVRGISYHSMKSEYRLMDCADKKNISVKFEDGLLKVIVPLKKNEEKVIDIE